MVGRVKSKGATLATTEVAVELAEALPAEFDAVTATTSVAPMSLKPST